MIAIVISLNELNGDILGIDDGIIDGDTNILVFSGIEIGEKRWYY